MSNDSSSGTSGELAAFLREEHGAILEEWQACMRQLPQGRDLPEPVLRDDLPQILDRLAHLMDAAQRGEPARGPGEEAQHHVYHRLALGFDLGQLVEEYSTLRMCILRLWERRNRTPPLTTVRSIDGAIDQAVSASVTLYVAARNRTLQALDRISTAALKAPTLDSFLRRLLDVFLETTGSVDTGMILLRENDHLRMRAAVGLEEELDLTVAIGEGFAGAIAAAGEPRQLQADEMGALVSTALRKKGLRTLYGVPLVDGDRVLGVAHMGSLSTSSFSDQDQRLFRAMVERATAAVAQHLLRERTQRLAEILELGDACLLIDDRWRITFVNANQQRLSRTRASETLGRVFWDVWPETRGNTKYWTEYHRVMEQRRPAAFEEYFAPLDLWTDVTAYPTRDGGIAVFFRDATARKRMDAALHAARTQAEAERRRWRSLFQQAPVPIALLRGPKLIYDFANPAYVELVGRRKLLSRPVREVFARDDVEDILSLLDAVMHTGETVTRYEQKVSLAWGGDERERDRYLTFIFQPYYESPGGPDGVLLFVFDVTATVQARQQLEQAMAQAHESQARLQAVLDYAPSPIFIKDREGKHQLVNPAFVQLSGMREEDILGRTDHELFADEIAEPLHHHDLQVLEGGETLQVEETMPSMTQGARVWLAAKFPLVNEHGERDAVCGIATDITDRKRLEEARERFVGVLGHDLRNPLNAIWVTTQGLLLREDVSEAQAKGLARIAASADRMRRIISDVIDWTRGRLGSGIPISPQPVDLGTICEQVVTEVQASCPERELRFVRHGDTHGRWDPDRMAQVVSNLLVNAVRHGAADRPVDVTLQGSDTEVVLQVHNQGEPIDPTVLPRLFEPFQQLAQRDAGKRGSLGLGLYIVREIIRAHGAHIDVRSAPEHGTTFVATLPKRIAR